ncbi:MAG: DNA-processing protein DprA [Clostridia bacterium]|nr:DNA-processing protein DprA [Clostridia bacterium]
MSKTQRCAAWVALSLALGPRSARLKPLLHHFGTPERIFAAEQDELLSVLPDLGKGALAALKFEKHEGEVGRILAYCDRMGVTVLTPDMPAYPAVLFAIAEPPAVLYCLGNMPQMGKRPFVGVVGTRDTDAYGERVAYKLSFELAAAGAVVVSGLADGIDGVAAAAAIDAGAPTIAVLGCGIDRVYPKHHTRLFSEVAEFGAVVTEYAPGTPPNSWNFPIRNRIISALSEAVVVVEGDEISGALITARYALLQGKSLFAVPGDVDCARSTGCNLLLRAGANIALSAEDILSHFRFLYRDTAMLRAPDDVMQYTGVTPEKLRAHGLHMASDWEVPTRKDLPRRTTDKKRVRAEKQDEREAHTVREALPTPETLASLTAAQRIIYDNLPDVAFTIDFLVGLGVPAKDAVAAMTLFEILGLVSSMPGGTYQKKPFDA